MTDFLALLAAAVCAGPFGVRRLAAAFAQSYGSAELLSATSNPPARICYSKKLDFAFEVDTMPTASVKWISEQQFLGLSPSGHATPIDADSQSNKAPSPMELLLISLGGCTASDMLSILEKKRQKLLSLVVECSGERAPEPPRIWTKIEVVFKLRGTLDESAVRRSLELTRDKYCSVAAMLNQSAEISWRYEIAPAP